MLFEYRKTSSKAMEKSGKSQSEFLRYAIVKTAREILNGGGKNESP